MMMRHLFSGESTWRWPLWLSALLLLGSPLAGPAQDTTIDPTIAGSEYEVIDLGPNTSVWDITDTGLVSGEQDTGWAVWAFDIEAFTASIVAQVVGGGVAARGVDANTNVVIGAMTTNWGNFDTSVSENGERSSEFWQPGLDNALGNPDPVPLWSNGQAFPDPALYNGQTVAWDTSKRKGWDVENNIAVGDVYVSGNGRTALRYDATDDIVAVLNGTELPIHSAQTRNEDAGQVRRINGNGFAVGQLRDDTAHNIRFAATVWVPETNFSGIAAHEFKGYTFIKLGNAAERSCAHGINDNEFPSIVGQDNGPGARWDSTDGQNWSKTILPNASGRSSPQISYVAGRFLPTNPVPLFGTGKWTSQTSSSQITSPAQDINDTGVIVGYSANRAGDQGDDDMFRSPRWAGIPPNTPNYHFFTDHIAWVWDWTNHFQDLHYRLVPDKTTDYFITSAMAIANNGSIAVNTLYWDGSIYQRRALVLVPPQPPKPPPTGVMLIVR